MKKLLVCAALAACGCCAYTHRRVIKAVINGEEIPPAPEWHFWCSNRRGN